MPHMRPVRPNPVCTSSTTNTMPCSSQMSRTPCTNSVGATTNPPSPRIGSITIAATLSAGTCVTNARRSDLSAESTSMPRYSCGYGTR